MGEIVQRWRIVYRRGPGASDVAQRAELEAWEEALAATGLPVASGSGVRPRPRLAMAPPLPTGLTAERELIDVQLTERLPAATVRGLLRPALPRDHELVDLFDVWIGAPPLAAQVVATDYSMIIRSDAGRARLESAVSTLLASPRLQRIRRRGDRETPYDLRPFLLGLSLDPAGTEGGEAGEAMTRMRLSVHPEQGTARPEDVVAALADEAGEPIEIVSGSRTRVWTADEAPPPPGSSPVPLESPLESLLESPLDPGTPHAPGGSSAGP